MDNDIVLKGAWAVGGGSDLPTHEDLTILDVVTIVTLIAIFGCWLGVSAILM